MIKTNRVWKGLLVALLVTSGILIACQKDAKDPSVTSAAKGGVSTPSTQYSKLTLSCAGGNTLHTIALTVTAGVTGAPSGFSIQWMRKPVDYNPATFVWPDYDATTGNFCKASFSGVPYGSKNTVQAGTNSYNLTTTAPGNFVTVYIGDLLNDELNQQLGLSTTACNDGVLDPCTQYIFRAFAHGDSKMNKSEPTIFDLDCATTACGDCARHGFGFWKEHTDQWPGNPFAVDADPTANYMQLGGHDYTAAQIESILKQQPNGNGLVILAHQLIGAKLNGLCTDVTGLADAQFVGKVVPPVGTSSATASSVAGLVATLHQHNDFCTDVCPPADLTVTQ